MKDLRQDSRCPVRCSNWVPPKYKSRVLPLDHHAPFKWIAERFQQPSKTFVASEHNIVNNAARVQLPTSIQNVAQITGSPSFEFSRK
jgi:hypothetical protein